MTRPRLQSFTPLLAASALACAGGGTLLGACAESESTPSTASDVVDAAPPPGEPALADAEAGSCTADDCAYFPAECAADAFCPNGLFDPTNPQLGMDWRTVIKVIRGRSASDVWLAGTAGTVAHFDGTAWTASDIGSQESQGVLWLPDGGEVSFGLGDSVRTIYTRRIDPGDAGSVSVDGWSHRPMPPGLGTRLRAAWSRPGSETLWVATQPDLWRLRLTPASTLELVPGIPSSLCEVSQCDQIRSIHGATDETLWAVGDHGATVRITGANGDAPSVTPFNSQTWVGLAGVWAASDTDVWAVGGPGIIRHYTGHPTRWDVVPDVPTSEFLNAVWGTSSTDVWAVGNAGVVLHYDGASWSRVKIAGLGARRPDLYTVWLPGPGHIWIGGHGIVLSLGGKP